MEASQFSNFSSKDFGSRIESSLRHLQKEKFFCDVTITCEGRKIDAHKVVLARGSQLFNNILKLKLRNESHPLIFLSDVKFSFLLNILDFMYQGEVCIDKSERNNFLAVARDLEVNDLTEEAFKDSKQSIEDKSKKQRLVNSPKQQFNLDYKIKTDNKLYDSHIEGNDLKIIDKLEDFEQFANEDFEDFKDSKQSIEDIDDKNKNQRLDNNSHNMVNAKSEGKTLKTEITESHDLQVDDFKDSKQSIEVIEDKNKKRLLDSSPMQQIKLDYRIKTDNILDSDIVVNDLKIDKVEDFEQFGDEDFDDESKGTMKNNLMDSVPTLDVNVDYKIKIEMENKTPEKNENIILIQDTGKGQRNSHVQKLQIRDIAKLSGNENASKTHFKCEQCNKTYSSAYILKTHILTIHEGMRYSCSDCDYKATNKDNLKKHVLSKHKGMQYSCSHCDYTATTTGGLKKHVLSIHEGKRYPCSYCDYKATSPSSLKAHVLSLHKGTRYPCAHCDYKATFKGDMKRHVLSKHKGMRYSCSHCDYTATTTGGLQKHVLSIHEGKRYPCSQCDYKATTANSLKMHVLSIHKGIRYPCSHCDYKATAASSLKSHVLSVHEGVRYPCSQCDYKTTEKKKLKTHIDKYHTFVKE